MVGLLKASTKICLHVTSNDDERSENSKILSVGQEIVNCILLDESMAFTKLKELCKSSLESLQNKNFITKTLPKFYSGYVAQNFKIVRVHCNLTV